MHGSGSPHMQEQIKHGSRIGHPQESRARYWYTVTTRSLSNSGGNKHRAGGHMAFKNAGRVEQRVKNWEGMPHIPMPRS
jgi:hypothetical protein